jgi:hypothetical protein
MLRGQKALMAIVSNDLTIASEKHVKGCFTDERDDALACRFFYWSRLMEKRYDVALVNLSKEFFLSETVISQRIMTRQAFLKRLREAETTVKELQKKYPFFSW